MIENINMTELENALAVVKNATDTLIEIAEDRLLSFYDGSSTSREEQHLSYRVADGDAVELIAFLDIVNIGDFDLRKDMEFVHNREKQIRERIRLKAESLKL